jgi:hypothetical protein
VPALPGSGYVASSLPIPSSPRGKVVRGPADVGVANWGPPPPAGDPSALAAEAAEVELPPGRGHGYLFGEAMVVSRLRRSWPSEGSPGPDLTEGLLGPRPRQRQPRRARPRRLADGGDGRGDLWVHVRVCPPR